MSKVIKNATLYRLNIGPYTKEKASGYYYPYTDTLAEVMVDFIKSIKPEESEGKRNRRGKIM